MSTTSNQSKEEQSIEIYNALNTRDSEALYHLADQLKEQGDDEGAEDLVAQAKKIDFEDWAFDRERDNQN